MKQRFRPQAKECFGWESDTDADEDDEDPDRPENEVPEEDQENPEEDDKDAEEVDQSPENGYANSEGNKYMCFAIGAI